MDKVTFFAVGVALAASLFAADNRTFISGSGMETIDENTTDLKRLNENGACLWDSDAATLEDLATIKLYGDDARPNQCEGYFPNSTATATYHTNGENTKYLDIDSGNTTIARKIGTERNVGDDGIYVDAMVQFTATDTAPEAAPDDKLLVWLYAPPEDETATSLMITAKKYKLTPTSPGELLESFTTCIYKVDADKIKIEEGKWYRLTIAAEMYEYKHLNWTTRFRVYIDDVQVVAADSEDGADTSEFLSLVEKSETISHIGFAGTGAVDNIVFATGTTHPPATPEESIEAFTCIIDDMAPVTNSSLAEAYAVITNQGASKALIALNGDYLITDSADCLTIGCDLTFDLNGNSLVSANRNHNIFTVLNLEEGPGRLLLKDSRGGGMLKFVDGIEASTYLIENQNNAKLEIGVLGDGNDFTLANGRVRNYPQNGDIPAGNLKIYGGRFSSLPVAGVGVEITDYSGICPDSYTLDRDDGEQYYTLKKTIPDINTITARTFTTRDAATNAAAAVTAPAEANLSDAEAATWKRYVYAEATDLRDGTWGVGIALVDDEEKTLQSQAENGTLAIADAIAGDGAEISVSAIPGLYYSIESSADSPANLTEGPRSLAGGGETTVTLTIEKSPDKGFYRVRISPIDNKNSN